MAINNANELRSFLSVELEKTSKKELAPAAANACANLAGKILSSVRMEMEYNKMIGISPNIDFLKENKQGALENGSTALAA